MQSHTEQSGTILSLMKKKNLHISTKSLAAIFAAVLVNAVLCFILTSQPVVVDNFVGEASMNPYPDGLDLQRRLMLYPGLILSVISVLIFTKSAIGKKAAAPDKILNYTIMLLTFLLGWVCIPYWANGLHQVFWSGTSSMYDPKSLLPYMDISVVWSTGVMLFYLLTFLLILVPLIIAILDIRKNGFSRKYLYAAAVYLLIFAAFRFAPNYMYWFLD